MYALTLFDFEGGVSSFCFILRLWASSFYFIEACVSSLKLLNRGRCIHSNKFFGCRLRTYLARLSTSTGHLTRRAVNLPNAQTRGGINTYYAVFRLVMPLPTRKRKMTRVTSTLCLCATALKANYGKCYLNQMSQGQALQNPIERFVCSLHKAVFFQPVGFQHFFFLCVFLLCVCECFFFFLCVSGYIAGVYMYVVPVIAQHNGMALYSNSSYLSALALYYYCCLPGTTYIAVCVVVLLPQSLYLSRINQRGHCVGCRREEKTTKQHTHPCLRTDSLS